MLDSTKLDNIAKQLFSVLPENFQNFEKNIQQQFKDILQIALSHIDIVTREEFDVQTKVLARTREKVEALQAQLDALLAKKEA